MFTKLLHAYYSPVDIKLPTQAAKEYFMFTVKPRAYTQEVVECTLSYSYI